MNEKKVTTLLAGVLSATEVGVDTSETRAHHRKMVELVRTLLAEVFQRKITAAECETVLGHFLLTPRPKL